MFFQKIIKESYPEINGLNHKYMNFKIEEGESTKDFFELQAALEVLDGAFVEMVESLKDEAPHYE